MNNKLHWIPFWYTRAAAILVANVREAAASRKSLLMCTRAARTALLLTPGAAVQHARDRLLRRVPFHGDKLINPTNFSALARELAVNFASVHRLMHSFCG